MNPTLNLKSITQKSLESRELTRDEALAVLSIPNENILELIHAAFEVRQAQFGKRVKLNYLINVKSGLCPEDCHYCTQSKLSDAPIPKYNLIPADDIIAQAERGMAVGAGRACLVASGRGPSHNELNQLCGSIEKVKAKYPNLEICACLGLLSEGQGDKLKDSGVYAYNHNINTSRSHYESICSTHSYDDRVDTVKKAQKSGMSACSGVLVGMGESDADIVDMAFFLRESKVDSIPVNFLVSIDKTPMEKTNHLNPWKCLKILALFRLVNPKAEIRISGGREVHLRHLQPFGLFIANSIFVGDYLTTVGQSARQDLEMIRDLGFTIQGQPDDFLDKVLAPAPHSAEIKKDSRIRHSRENGNPAFNNLLEESLQPGSLPSRG